MANNAIPTLRYLWLTVRHKAFVFRAGLRTRAPLWNLIVHDLSKFSPAEAPHYGRQFFGDRSDPYGFACAWNHHQKHNPHHWEYWIPETGHDRSGYPGREPLPMPEPYVREMVADWFGASRAYEGTFPRSRSEWPWLQTNLPKITPRLHVDTQRRLAIVLNETLGHD